MEATPVATAEVQPSDTLCVRLFARFRLAQQLWFVSSTLTELEATPAVDARLLQHYRREFARLERELAVSEAGRAR